MSTGSTNENLPEQRVGEKPRTKQYMVARTSGPLPAGVEPFDVNSFEQILKQRANQPGPVMRYVRRVAPPALGMFGADEGSKSIVVAEMEPRAAEALRQNQGPRVTVEEDAPVQLARPVPGPVPIDVRDPGVLPMSEGIRVTITVRGRGGAGLADADVFLYGTMWPAQGRTDPNGTVQLTLFGETGTTFRGLYVKPHADYWDFWEASPALDPAVNNVVNLVPLDQANTVAGFPNAQLVGWGLQAMRIDLLPPNFRGSGVKVAVVDSGIADSHQDLLQRVTSGYDTIQSSMTTWNQDQIQHGTHCAGVIGGSDNAVGIRGIAPDATLYAFKIFPDGRFSHLIESLNKCIELEADVVNLSLGSEQRSELVEQKLQECKRLGVACIVAAGNSGDAVQYPARSNAVLAVSAIGRYGTFPDSSYHRTVPVAGLATSEGYFAANFSCFGTEIGVAGPGVAVISSVPPNNYAVMNGTSMAAPHITGLAALVLAHHPDFRPNGPYAARNAARVDRLFQILKDSCEPLSLGDRGRTGAGIPNALKALQVQPAPRPAPAISQEMLQQLLMQLLQGAGSVAGGSLPPQGAPAAGPSFVPQSAFGPQTLSPFSTAPGLLPPVFLNPQTLGPPNTSLPAADSAALIEQLRRKMQQAGLTTTPCVAETQAQSGVAPTVSNGVGAGS